MSFLQLPQTFSVLFESVSYYYYPMVLIFSITADLVAASRFLVGLIEDDWTGFSSSVAHKDGSVPSAGVQDSLIRKS